MEPREAAFSTGEVRGRFDGARAALKAAGVSGAVLVAPESLYYLSGFEAFTSWSAQALVIGVDDPQPTLLIRDCDIGHAPATSSVEDVRTYHFGRDDPAALAAEAVAERTAAGEPIGLELASYALPTAYGLALTNALNSRQVLDCTETVGRLRLAKSEAELRYVREAARITSAGLAAFNEHVRTGITEIALAGKVETAMREAGSEFPAMPTWLAGGPRYSLGHGTPADRVIGQGEFVGTEFAGVSHRYHTAVMQIASLGRRSGTLVRMNDIGKSAMAAGLAAGKPGRPVGDMERAAFAVVREMGRDPGVLMRYGYGIGIAYPPSWLEPLHVISESDDVLEVGMTLMLHVLGIGGTYEVTVDGPKLLCGAQELRFVE